MAHNLTFRIAAAGYTATAVLVLATIFGIHP